MKRTILCLSLAALSVSAFSQTKEQDYYTPMGGLLGAANFTKFRTTGDAAPDYNLGVGWSGGAWVNFPVTKVFSIEPQLMYSSYNFDPKDNTVGFSGDMRTWSLPVLFKFNVGKYVALNVGPQWDFVNDIKSDNSALYSDGSFEKRSTSITGGVEVMPLNKLTVFGRYLHGVKNMSRSETPQVESKSYLQGFQVGLKYRLFGKHVVIPADTDGDGINDKLDKCPTVAGVERYQGCPVPDTDGDGINDEADKCPSVAGTAKYNGCPVPDTDGDGINDETDKCPNEAGIEKYNGCPPPDGDGDGVNDEEDKCPTVAGKKELGGCPDSDNDGIVDSEDKCPTIAGPRENNGCPAIPKFNAANVQFVTGSAKLTSAALTELNSVVSYMKEYPETVIEIQGHTDNVGKESVNQTLSEKRAAAVATALQKKGIDKSRISSAGYGMSQPVADNSTKEGRAKNRRVEFRISQKDKN